MSKGARHVDQVADQPHLQADSSSLADSGVGCSSSAPFFMRATKPGSPRALRAGYLAAGLIQFRQNRRVFCEHDVLSGADDEGHRRLIRQGR